MHEIVTKYLQVLATIPVCDERSFASDLQQTRNGDETARRRLLGGCLAFAYRIAESMWVGEKEIEYIGFVEQATVGLQKAVRKFEGTKLKDFELYAEPIIRMYLLRTLDNPDLLQR
jgi:DNA-directed RNA polymerase specialized sigma subunit